MSKFNHFPLGIPVNHRGHLAVACLWVVSKSMEQGPVKTVEKIRSICFGAIFREFMVTTCNNVKQWWGICHAKRLGSVPRVTCQCRGMTRSFLLIDTGTRQFFCLQTIRHWVGLYDIPCKSWANHEKTFTVWCHQWWLENPRTVHDVLMGKSSGWGILQPYLMTPKASLISHHPIIIPLLSHLIYHSYPMIILLISHDYPINHCGQNFVFLQPRNNSPSLAMTQVPAKKPRYLAHGPHGMSRWKTWKPQRLNSGLIGQWW